MIGTGPVTLQDQHLHHSSIEGESTQHGIAAAIDRHPVRSFATLTALYLIIVLALSALKLLWLDELITIHLARLSSVHELWHALAVGADPNPPVTYILVHWSRQIFGDREFAYRVPSALGYWIGLVSLFVYLKRLLRGSWAIFGCIVSMCMAAFDYSFESRSYAIFYGLAMFAFLCWTIRADVHQSSSRRVLALAGMTLALAAGISTNYFAVLAFLPPAAGELVRTRIRARRPRARSDSENGSHRLRRGPGIVTATDFGVWLAFALAASPLLVYRPLIAHSIAQFAPYAWNKVSIDQVFDSYTEMVEVILYPLLALFVLGIVVLFTKERVLSVCRECRATLLPRWAAAILSPNRSRTLLPPHEAAGIFVFMAYPLCGYIIASIHGGMLSPRFVIPVCFGFATVGAVSAQYLFGNLRHSATVLLCVVLAWFVCREAVVGYSYKQQKKSFYSLIENLERAEREVPEGSPIAIPDPLLALTFRHYAPATLADHIVFPLDFPAVRFFRHDDSPEENIWAGRSLLYKMRIITLAEFQRSAGPYLIIASPGNWLLEDLRKHRYTFIRLPVESRAEDIGGFTPIARGVPAFYETRGDRITAARGMYIRPPVPFQESQNLPSAKWYVPPELLQDE